MFIPLGTVIKNEDDVKKYCVGKDVSVRSSWLNDTKQFDVSEYYSTYSSIQSRDYTIYCKQTENGFKVFKVYRWR